MLFAGNDEIKIWIFFFEKNIIKVVLQQNLTKIQKHHIFM